MKQAQSHRRSRAPRPQAWSGPSRAVGSRTEAGVLGTLEFLFGAVWWILTLPFRLVFGAISLLGRMTGVVVGFSLMVVGMALGAGPFYLIGVPIFLVGLFLTLRCLG